MLLLFYYNYSAGLSFECSRNASLLMVQIYRSQKGQLQQVAATKTVGGLFLGMPAPATNQRKCFGGGWSLLMCSKSGTQLVPIRFKGYNIFMISFF